MNERCFQEHLGRIDRLLELVAAPDPTGLIGRLRYEDVLVFAVQSMWHLKDWILNDPEFGAADIDQLSADIHSKPCLRVCSDIANASKHLALKRPKTNAKVSDSTGVHLDTSKGVFQVLYYVVSSPDDPYHGIEVRDLLVECRATWQELIDTYHLSDVDSWFGST